MLLFYNSYCILPLFDYCDVVWNCCTDVQANKLERLQNYARRIILKKRKSTSATLDPSTTSDSFLSSAPS